MIERRTEEITIGETIFTVEEVSARVMLPLVQKIAEDSSNQENQIEMMNLAVKIHGQPIDAGDLGMGTFMKLMAKVQQMNGMDIAGDEGNDLQPKG